MDGKVFVADYEYAAQSESELSYQAGDEINIISTEGEWIYGEHVVTHAIGWVAPSYGHIRAQSSPYEKLSDSEKNSKRVEKFKEILSSESEFISKLKLFIEAVITPLTLRDTAFKRNFLGDPSVGLSFSLLDEIYNASSNFSGQLKESKGEKDIAKAYLGFAPSLQLFAQYASENSKLLNTIKSQAKPLLQFIDKETKFPHSEELKTFLILPLQHYPKYKAEFQEYVWLTPTNLKDAHSALSPALDAIIAQSTYVDIKLKEEEESLLLLTLQNQFSGNRILFTPTRRIRLDGEVDRIRVGKNKELVTKAYYAHIFNDAFIYSSRNLMGYFKLHRVFDLRQTVLEKLDIEGVTNAFSLRVKDEGNEKFEHFRVPSAAIFTEWFELLQSQINTLKVKKVNTRMSTMTKVTTLTGVNTNALGPRALHIYKFLQSELQFFEAVSLLNIVVIQPLLDASKGAPLTASKVTTSSVSGASGSNALQLKNAESGNQEALFGNAQSTMSKSQMQQITEALQAVDVQIFLRAAEGIYIALKDFVQTLESFCVKENWSDNMKIGPFFNSASAMALYNQFKSYATGQQAALRVLKTLPFANFYKESEQYLSTSPGSLSDKIILPRTRVTYYLTFIESLSELTPTSSPDSKLLQESLHSMEKIVAEIEELIRLKENFEKLMAIQNSIMSGGLKTDPVLHKLASMDRTFIKEGDLKKVCRKKNKTFRFWLFNDYLIYASSLGGQTYTLNRCLDLSKCTVKLHNSASTKYALDVFGAEKSFVVIAASAGQQDEWFRAIQQARDALDEKMGIVKADNSVQAAPLWVQDSESGNCTICNQPFNFFSRRRHHCRKCGALVCGEHSSHTEVLPHIHKSNKQRICDNCFNNKTVSPAVSPIKPETPTKTATVAFTGPAIEPKVTVSKLNPDLKKTFASSNDKAVDNSRQASPTPKKLASNLTQAYSGSNAAVQGNIAPAASGSTSPSPKFTANKSTTVPQSKPLVYTNQTGTPTAGKLPQTAPPPIPNAPPIPVMAPPPIPATPPPETGTQYAEVSNSNSDGITRRTGPKPPPTPPPISLVPVPIPPTDPKRQSTSLANLLASDKNSGNPFNNQISAPVVSKPPPPNSKGNPPPPPNSKGNPPPPPPPSNKSVASTANSAPPPPSVPQSAPTQSDPVVEEAEDVLKKYRKMKEMNLPDGAIRQKMITDGFLSSDIDDFLNGKLKSMPVPTPTASGGAGLDIQLQSLSPLRTPPPSSPLPKKISLLDEIQMGQKLKAVQADDTRMKKDAVQGGGGLQGILASAMANLRLNMKLEENGDSDSDSSGFGSDTDTDDD